jgi:PAS domain S-box-containing protein
VTEQQEAPQEQVEQSAEDVSQDQEEPYDEVPQQDEPRIEEPHQYEQQEQSQSMESQHEEPYDDGPQQEEHVPPQEEIQQDEPQQIEHQEQPQDQDSQHKESYDEGPQQEEHQALQEEDHPSQEPHQKEQTQSSSTSEDIKKRKELLERIIDNAPSIIIGIDHHGKITIFNEVAEMVTGFNKTEAIGNSFVDLLIPKDQREETLAIFEKSKHGVPLFNIEKDILTKNKENRQILWSSAPIEDDDERMIREIYIGNDITEKSIMINEVIRQNKELTAINSVGFSLSQASDLDSTLINALARVLDLAHPAKGALYLLNDSQDKLEMRARKGISPETTQAFSEFSRGKGIISKVLGAKHHVLLKNLLLFSERSQEILKNEGIKSVAFLPLRSKRGVIGVMAIGVMDPQKLNHENIKVFTTISNQIGIIVDNIRLFQELSMVSKEWENTFNTITDPMLLISNESKVLWVNIAYARMMSAIPEDLIGKGCCDIFHNESSPIHTCIHKKVFETKAGFTEEIYDPTTGMTLLVTCSPYNNSRGDLIGTLIVTRDITEKKEAENEIKYLKEFNENIIENLGEGVEIIGPDHKIQYMSNNFHKSIGKDVVGKTCYEVHFESETPCDGCPILNGIENMKTETVECQTNSAENMLVTHSPLKNQDGSYSAILLFKPRSINEMPETTEEKEPLTQETVEDTPSAPENMDVQDTPNIRDFESIVFGIQHEMNNPLGGILGCAKALGDEKDPLKMRILAKEIQDSANRANKLLIHLLEQSKSQEDSIGEKIDLNEVIINSLNTMNQDEKFENVQVETDLHPVPKINCDPVDILNVFINLISNSLDSMEGQGKIHISTKAENGDVQMVFRDTGSYIPKELQDRLFDPFYGVSQELGGEEDSNKSGLRMFTVSNILKKYNAPISVSSKEGDGTSFIINFPHKKKPKPKENN